MDKAFSKWWHGFQYLLWDSDIPTLQKEMKMHSENHAAFKLLAKPKASAANNWAMKHNTGTFCHRWRGVQDQAQGKHMCLKIPSVSGGEQVTSHRIAVKDWLHWGMYGRQFNTSDMSLKLSCHGKMEGEEIQKGLYCCATTARKTSVFFLCCSEKI